MYWDVVASDVWTFFDVNEICRVPRSGGVMLMLFSRRLEITLPLWFGWRHDSHRPWCSYYSPHMIKLCLVESTSCWISSSLQLVPSRIFAEIISIVSLPLLFLKATAAPIVSMVVSAGRVSWLNWRILWIRIATPPYWFWRFLLITL